MVVGVACVNVVVVLFDSSLRTGSEFSERRPGQGVHSNPNGAASRHGHQDESDFNKPAGEFIMNHINNESDFNKPAGELIINYINNESDF